MPGWGCGGSWRCAATRPRARRSSCRIRTASPARPSWSTALRAVGDFEIAVAAYPEVHPEAASPAADIENLKRKLDAGAEHGADPVLLRQRRLPALPRRLRQGRDHRADHPGILPVENFAKMLNFAGRCRAAVPEWMHKAFARAETPEEAHLLSVSIAAEQCRRADRRGRRASARLYAQQSRPDLRRLPGARLCRGAAGLRRGRERGGLR